MLFLGVLGQLTLFTSFRKKRMCWKLGLKNESKCYWNCNKKKWPRAIYKSEEKCVTTYHYRRGIVLLQRCHDLTNDLKMIQCRWHEKNTIAKLWFITIPIFVLKKSVIFSLFFLFCILFSHCRNLWSQGEAEKYGRAPETTPHQVKTVRCRFHLEEPVCQRSLVLGRPRHTSRPPAGQQDSSCLEETENTARASMTVSLKTD